MSNVKITFLHITFPPVVFPRLYSRSLHLHHVHYSSEYSHYLLFSKPSPLCRRADDTQLFLSFYPTDFDSSIEHLQNALNRISSWMTANLLTLNSSKTAFLLIGLSKQLAKIHNSSLNTTHSARNPWLHVRRTPPHLFRPDLIVFKSCYYHIHQFRCVSVHTSILKQLPPSPLPLFTPNLTNATLYHYLRKSQITRIQQIHNSLARACQSPQIQSHHSHPTVSALAKNNRAY